MMPPKTARRMPDKTPEHRLALSRSIRATHDARRAALQCDFCERVTGNVRKMTLKGYTVAKGSTPRNPLNKTLVAGSILTCQDCWETFGQRCDSCGEGWRDVGNIRRFAIYAYAREEPSNKRRRMRNVGHINLCRKCWKKTAGTRSPNDLPDSRRYAGPRRLRAVQTEAVA